MAGGAPPVTRWHMQSIVRLSVRATRVPAPRIIAEASPLFWQRAVKARLRCGALIGVLLLAGPAGADVQVRTQTDRYDIQGLSAAQLRTEMSARGPVGADGRRYDGYTRWYVSWRYTYRGGTDVCGIDRVTTEVRVTTMLPHWMNEARADAPLREQWRRYLAALTTHEDGHAQNGLAAANEIDAAIAR